MTCRFFPVGLVVGHPKNERADRKVNPGHHKEREPWPGFGWNLTGVWTNYGEYPENVQYHTLKGEPPHSHLYLWEAVGCMSPGWGNMPTIFIVQSHTLVCIGYIVYIRRLCFLLCSAVQQLCLAVHLSQYESTSHNVLSKSRLLENGARQHTDSTHYESKVY